MATDAKCLMRSCLERGAVLGIVKVSGEVICQVIYIEHPQPAARLISPADWKLQRRRSATPGPMKTLLEERCATMLLREAHFCWTEMTFGALVQQHGACAAPRCIQGPH